MKLPSHPKNINQSQFYKKLERKYGTLRTPNQAKSHCECNVTYKTVAPKGLIVHIIKSWGCTW